MSGSTERPISGDFAFSSGEATNQLVKYGTHNNRVKFRTPYAVSITLKFAEEIGCPVVFRIHSQVVLWPIVVYLSEWGATVTHQPDYNFAPDHHSSSFAPGKLFVGDNVGDCRTISVTRDKSDKRKIEYEYSGKAACATAHRQQFATRFGVTASDYVKVALFVRECRGSQTNLKRSSAHSWQQNQPTCDTTLSS